MHARQGDGRSQNRPARLTCTGLVPPEPPEPIRRQRRVSDFPARIDISDGDTLRARQRRSSDSYRTCLSALYERRLLRQRAQRSRSVRTWSWSAPETWNRKCRPSGGKGQRPGRRLEAGWDLSSTGNFTREAVASDTGNQAMKRRLFGKSLRRPGRQGYLRIPVPVPTLSHHS